ncbi:hypothetical protein LTR95_013267 [Oleoguttula sp. CCFEE 5521]
MRDHGGKAEHEETEDEHEAEEVEDDVEDDVEDEDADESDEAHEEVPTFSKIVSAPHESQSIPTDAIFPSDLDVALIVYQARPDQENTPEEAKHWINQASFILSNGIPYERAYKASSGMAMAIDEARMPIGSGTVGQVRQPKALPQPDMHTRRV